MRPNPPFDPRIAQGSLYAPGPSPMYLQPVVHPGPPAQYTYPPGPPYSPSYSKPTYPMAPPQHQVIPQIVPSQQAVQNAQVTNIPPQTTVSQSQSGFTAIHAQSETTYKNKQQIQYKQIQVQQQQQQQQPQQIQQQQIQQIQQQQIQQQQIQQQQQQQQQIQQQQKQNEKQDEVVGEQKQNEQIIMFWQHKFMTILQKFQLIFEKVQGFRIDFQHLNDELKAVDSQQQWNQAKQHHQDYMEQLQQFIQQLAGVINQNANFVGQNQNQLNDQPIWKQRYFQLFQGYKNMEQQFFQLKQSKGTENPDGKIADLMNNYRQLQRAYSQAVNQLSQLKQQKQRNSQTLSVDKNYRQKLDFALGEAQKYKQMLQQLSKQNEDLDAMVNEIKQQKTTLQQTLKNTVQTNVQQNYEQFKRAINERDDEINLLSKQLKDLSQKYNYLVDSHNMIQNKLQQQDPVIKAKITQLQQIIQNKNKQINQVKNKISQGESRQKKNLQVSEEYQRLVKTKTAQIQQKNQQIMKIRKQMNNAVTIHKNQSQKDLSQFKKDFDGKIKKIQQQYEDKLQILKKKLRKKQQQGQNTALLNIKIQSLDKKNKMLLQQIQTLSKESTVREKQMIEMRRVSQSQQKVKQLQYQYNIAIEQKEQLSALILQKNYDIDGLQSQINEFETRIKELSSKNYVSSSKPLLAQIQQLNNLVQLKQNQINKCKANLTLKVNNNKDLQNQMEKVKNSIIVIEKNFQRQKDTYQQNIRMLQRKNQQNEKKMRDLEFQFGSVMKKNLQDQIKNLRSQNQSRQQNIIRLQAQELQLRSRISHYQRVRGTHSSDMQQLTSRIKQLQNSKFQMIRKMQTSFRDVKKKQKQFKQLAETTSQLKDRILKLQGEIILNEKLIKQKDKVIQDLQGQVLITNSRLAYITQQHDNLRMRRRDETDLFYKQSDELKRKIFEYEHQKVQRKQFKQKFSTQITKIQNQMIQQLKEQKQFLQNQLSSALTQISNIGNNDDKINKSIFKKSKHSQGIEYIQKRLFQFNKKVDDIIVKNKQINSRQFGNNRQNNINVESNQNSIRQRQDQIKSLKSQIQQLRKYITKLQIQAAGQTTTIRYNSHSQAIYMQQQKTYKQRIQFYQSQTTELESRVQNLLKVNGTLKERLDALLKGESKNSAVSLYKQQLSISEETIESLNTKIKKLSDENRGLKSSNNQSITKMCRQYQDKIFECENKIFGLQRKISNLQLQKTKTQNQRAIIQRNLTSVQSQLHSIKSSTQKQVQNHQKNSKQLSNQVINFQNQIGQLLGKIRLLQSQNNRLTQAIHTSYSQQHILLNTPVKGTPKNMYKK